MKRRWVLGVVAALAACSGEDKTGASPTEPSTPTDPSDPPEPTDGTGPADHTGDPTATADSGEHSAVVVGPPTLFVATGDLGRVTVSCDGGRTWPVNHSLDDTVRCFEDDFDCNHHLGAGRGVTYGDGAFVATYGWGYPGSVQRLGAGDVDFVTVFEGHTFAGLAFDAGVFVASDRPPFRSDDAGSTWAATGDVTSDEWNVRRTGAGDGLFLVAFESYGTDLNVSSDGGLTFSRPREWPAECGHGLQFSGGLTAAHGVVLVVGADGTACVSTDRGQTFSVSRVGDAVTAHLLVTPTGFETWGRVGYAPFRFSSADGVSWTAEPTTTRYALGGEGSGPSIRAVARADDGTYAAVSDGWMSWYEQQRFYRSTDGLVWDELPEGAFVGSHPIGEMAVGPSDAAICP